MAILRCRMCGGTLAIQPGKNICKCEYCQTEQTVPVQDDEKKLNLISRAERLRRMGEFDKACGVYETVISDYPEEADAYWGLVLCRYGIEYVEDPKDGRMVPTCHRSSFDSVLDDPDFEIASEYADTVCRKLYREQAKEIERLRREIIEISSKEEPYDVFISYKETDENGERTIDSVLAQDIYQELTKAGYRVFFSRISLESRLGQDYEPVIFSALNSSKVMLVVGTSYENYEAVWVKNEWSRFLKMMDKGEQKVLIPCFKDIDAYDMPKEFARLQAQNLGRIGAIQDILRGIQKIVPLESADQNRSGAASLSIEERIKNLNARGQLALENHEFEKAREVFDQALNLDPENPDACLGMDMANKRADTWEAYEKICGQDDGFLTKYLQYAYRFSGEDPDSKIGQLIKACNEKREKRAEEARRQKTLEEERIQRIAYEKELRCRLSDIMDNLVVGIEHGEAILKPDGRVISTAKSIDLSGWYNIGKLFSVFGNFPLGIRKDGSLEYSNYQRIMEIVNKKAKKGNVIDFTGWTQLKKIDGNNAAFFGLRTDGKVLFTGNIQKYDRKDLAYLTARDFVMSGYDDKYCLSFVSQRGTVTRGLQYPRAAFENIERIYEASHRELSRKYVGLKENKKLVIEIPSNEKSRQPLIEFTSRQVESRLREHERCVKIQECFDRFPPVVQFYTNLETMEALTEDGEIYVIHIMMGSTEIECFKKDLSAYPAILGMSRSGYKVLADGRILRPDYTFAEGVKAFEDAEEYLKH